MHLLKIELLNKYVRNPRSRTDRRLLRDISLEIPEGKRVGLIGESGCGKTTLAKTILHLNSHTHHPKDNGKVYYRNNAVHHLSRREFRSYRVKLQLIYQDPFTSLNQKMTIENILAEAIRLKHPRLSKSDAKEKIYKLAEEYSIHHNQLQKRATTLSGGECRRVGIARVMALEPDFLIADEPVASLDASIKDQIMELLVSRVKTLMTISHDLRVISKYSNMVVVMYSGTITEIIHKDETVKSVYTPGFQFFHPYSKVLENSILYFNEKHAGLTGLADTADISETNNGLDVPETSCPYLNHCPIVRELDSKQKNLCKNSVPQLKWHKQAANLIACHHADYGQN